MTPSSAAPTTTPETRPALAEVTSPIKPSEAIRLGCLTTVQTFGYYRDDGATCAIGAMAVGFGGNMGKAWAFEDLTEDFDCPVAGCDNDDCDSVIPHLNDSHRWSRERIADWLESLGL